MSHYDADILLWSKRQGELLRRHAAGELVNEAEVGWPNIPRRSRAWDASSFTPAGPS